jgi:hypothetical protein
MSGRRWSGVARSRLHEVSFYAPTSATFGPGVGTSPSPPHLAAPAPSSALQHVHTTTTTLDGKLAREGGLGTKVHVVTIQSGWRCSFQRMRRPAHAATINPVEVFLIEATPHDTNLLWRAGARGHNPSRSGFRRRRTTDYGPTDWRRPQTA